MRHWIRMSCTGLSALTLLATVACGDAPTQPTAPVGVSAATPPSDIGVDLNPQPEPPSGPLIMDFLGSFDGSTFYGQLTMGDLSCGSFQLDQIQPRSTGQADHLSFTLQVTGANPDFALSADVTGLANQQNGLLSLNGLVTDGVLDGAHAHIQGQLESPSGDGAVSGQIMLRPQPTPSGVANGVQFPPSPCSS